jgi:phage FluMu protein Com
MKCNRCNFEGTPNEFEASFSVYHDVKCPKCGTTNIDTSDIRNYDYGENNFSQID